MEFRPPNDAAAAIDWQPRPSYDRLALHRWEMGQVLHPAQFRAQEEALLEHVGMRGQLTGLPGRGVALLRWGDAQLESGDLALTALTVVLASGRLIDVPGNAVLTTRTLVLPSKSIEPVSIYLHVRGELRPDGARNLPPYSLDEPEVRRAIYQVELSTEPGIDGGQERMKLAELSFRDGVWSLTPFVPPLIRIGRGTTPFLQDILAAVVASLGEFESELVKRAADSMTSADSMGEVRRMLTALYRVQAVLADHGYGAETQAVALHPFHLFVALRDFYLEVAVQQGARFDGWPPRYRHDDLRACFDPLARGIIRTLEMPAAVSPRLPFHRDEYWFVTELFPAELPQASAVFLLLERTAHGDELAAPPIPDLKLASPLRAEEIYTKALEGVPLRAIPSLGFAQAFGHRATVFQLDTQSREWRHAVSEGAVCFAALPGLEGFTAALFWQRRGHA
ncbi:MAG TPA: type VI secretion system baseplate subunit TssK [Kofleriaceae bacterium]|nr:type VI secretion system baseplate subunit TssK [Kofleriaceae bacterium]